MLVDSGATMPGVGVALKVLQAAAGALSLSVPLGRPRRDGERLTDQDRRVRRLLRAVQRMVSELSSVSGAGLPLIVDGVYRVHHGDDARFEGGSPCLGLNAGPGSRPLVLVLDGDRDLDVVVLQGQGSPPGCS